jgi:hypothetical protein
MNEVDKPVFTTSTLAKRTVERHDYYSYLQSEEWRRKSGAAKADNPRCSLCNRKSKPLHAHHRTYVRCGNENFYDLTVLCSDCHDLFHDYYGYDHKLGCFNPKKSFGDKPKPKKKRKKKRIFYTK